MALSSLHRTQQHIGWHAGYSLPLNVNWSAELSKQENSCMAPKLKKVTIHHSLEPWVISLVFMYPMWFFLVIYNAPLPQFTDKFNKWAFNRHSKALKVYIIIYQMRPSWHVPHLRSNIWSKFLKKKTSQVDTTHAQRTVDSYFSARKVHLASLWPLTSDVKNLFNNAHSHGKYLCLVSLKSLH